MQRQDFEGIFRAMGGLPVTIRFLDPPLHEFLPTEEGDIQALAAEMRLPVAELKATIAALHEFNPMMGHRGCRLAVSYPEIAVMQTTAVIEAALNVAAEGIAAEPEIMIPLVCDVQELKRVKKTVTETADRIIAERNAELSYKVGTMIELPRAALTADAIATEAEFFSFGTNDLTQMTYGFSRDDAGKFLKDYYEAGIFESDPFAKLDQTGVGRPACASPPKGPCNPSVHKNGHLRRARRRPVQHRVLPQAGADLRLLLALPRTDCTPCRRAGPHSQRTGLNPHPFRRVWIRRPTPANLTTARKGTLYNTMKKCILFTLLCALALPLLVACGDPASDESGESSSAPSETSGTESEPFVENGPDRTDQQLSYGGNRPHAALHQRF